MTSRSSTSGSTACAAGTTPACCASAMPHTPCHPWAVSASTSAIADAVATAGLLAEPLRTHQLTTKQLAAVRRRRIVPTVPRRLCNASCIASCWHPFCKATRRRDRLRRC